MLDINPVLKERLMACGAFAGIGIGAIAALNVMITGGFDFGAHRAPYDREQPNAYVRAVQAAQSFGDNVRSVSWDDPLSLNGGAATTTDTLVGADDGAPPPETDTLSTDELHREIAALYSQDDVEQPSYDDTAASDEPGYEESSYEADEESEAAIVYENASPW